MPDYVMRIDNGRVLVEVPGAIGVAKEVAKAAAEAVKADQSEKLATQAAEDVATALASLGDGESAWPRGKHRGWRLAFKDIPNGSSIYIAELAFFEGIDGPNFVGPGAAFATPSAVNGDGPPNNAFDGNPATRWEMKANGIVPTPFYLGYLADAPFSVSKFMVAPSAARPSVFTLQYSDNTTTGLNGDWFDAWTPPYQGNWQDEARYFVDPLYGVAAKSVVLGSPGADDLFVYQNGQYQNLGIVEKAAEALKAAVGAAESSWPRGRHKAWRLNIPVSNSPFSVGIQNLGFNAVPGGPTQTMGGAAFGSYGEDGVNYNPPKAFDNTDSEWIGDQGQYRMIGYIFPAPVSVNQVLIKAGAGKAPRVFFLEYSDDTTNGFNGSWTKAFDIPEQVNWGAGGEVRAFTDPLYGQGNAYLAVYQPVSGALGYQDESGVLKPIAIGEGGEAGGGLTEFQRRVVPAMRLGRAPRWTPNKGYSLTKLADNIATPPAGYPTQIYWDSQAIRWEGTFTRQAGPNGWGQTYAFNAGDYKEMTPEIVATNYFSNVSARFEFDYTGSSLVVMFMGGTAPFRVMVDGDYIDEDDGKVIDFSLLPPDGNPHYFRLDLITGTKKRIMFDHYGGIGLNRIFIQEGAALTAPAEARRPAAYADGTSVTENGNGWIRILSRALNLDTWDTGVGATGIFNNGYAERRNMYLRKNWRHRPYDLGIHQGIINDGGDNNLGSDGTYRDRFTKYLDRYRLILDDWFLFQPDSPWIACGYLPIYQGDTGIDPIHFAMCDATEQAVAEYAGKAHFIPPFPHDGVFPGNGGNSVPTNFYLNNVKDGAPNGDFTHPDWIGAPQLGLRIAKQIRDLVYGGRF